MQNSRTRETNGEEKRWGREEERRAADRHLRSQRFVNPFCPPPPSLHPARLVVSRTLATFAFLGERVTRRRSRKGAIVFHEIQAPFARGKLFGL